MINLIIIFGLIVLCSIGNAYFLSKGGNPVWSYSIGYVAGSAITFIQFVMMA